MNIEPTPDGSFTLYSAKFKQHYHSKHGAYNQAQYVYLQGSQSHTHPHPQVLEVGFGVAMNFLTTLQHCALHNTPLHYWAYEFDPVPRDVMVAYSRNHAMFAHPLWQQVLQHWGTGGQFRYHNTELTLVMDDATTAAFPENWATAVYLDGFSKDVNPELWTPEFCNKVALSMQVGGVLATYSAAGLVRRALSAAGLTVYKHKNIGGKRECITAQK